MGSAIIALNVEQAKVIMQLESRISEDVMILPEGHVPLFWTLTEGEVAPNNNWGISIRSLFTFMKIQMKKLLIWNGGS